MKKIELLIKGYKDIIEATELISCHFIVEYQGKTVGTDEHNRTIISRAPYPCQFSQSAVDKILSLNWNDKKTVYFYKDWYKKELVKLENLLKTELEQIQFVLADISYNLTNSINMIEQNSDITESVENLHNIELSIIELLIFVKNKVNSHEK